MEGRGGGGGQPIEQTQRSAASQPSEPPLPLPLSLCLSHLLCLAILPCFRCLSLAASPFTHSAASHFGPTSHLSSRKEVGERSLEAVVADGSAVRWFGAPAWSGEEERRRTSEAQIRRRGDSAGERLGSPPAPGKAAAETPQVRARPPHHPSHSHAPLQQSPQRRASNIRRRRPAVPSSRPHRDAVCGLGCPERWLN